MPPRISSPQNARIKKMAALRRRAERDRRKLMLIDGERALMLALRNNFPLEDIFYEEESVSPETLNAFNKKGVPLHPLSADVFKKISYGNSPDPFVGLAPQPVFSLEDLPIPSNPLYLIAEGIEKPGNLGAILRSADAAGVTGLIICDSRTDIYNPNVIRASRGSFFTVPMARSGSVTAIRWLKEHGVRILSSSPAASLEYSHVDMTGPAAIAVGSEHQGLSSAWLDETLIRIPMRGQVDSMNTAQSATVLIFEALRQRRSR